MSKLRTATLETPPRPAWLSPNLYSFQSHYLEVKGCRIHYLDEGEGPVLLLLHGNPTWSFLYRDIIKGLSSSFRCIALDYPGFGFSQAYEGYPFTPQAHMLVVEEFVKQLNLSEITLMVQDWGGPIGLGVAGRQPERFKAFVIGNSWAWPVNGDRHFEFFSRLAGGRVGGFLIKNFNAFVNLLIPAGITRHKVSQEVMAAYRGPFATKAARKPTHIFPGEILRSRNYLAQVEQNLLKLRNCPAIILWGDRDRAFRQAERQHFEQLFPEHHTLILKGAGHFIQEDAADEIVAAILNWWQHLSEGG